MHASQSSCPRRRLAESPFAAVDVCGCGMMLLHVGAVTIRFTPRALSELLSTLGRAVAVHAAHGALNEAMGHAERGCA